jgi:glucose-6-phosphate isomerase
MTTFSETMTETNEFNKTPAFMKLTVNAKQPFDLTKPGNITPERIGKYTCSGAGYKLLYGMEKVTDDVLRNLEELAEERGCVEKMRKMQAGEVMNFIERQECDNRAVLHTAMRDLFDHPQTSAKAKEATALAKREHKKLEQFCEKLEKSNQFNDLILVGIGGSELGPKALYLALDAYQKKGKRAHFVGNVDPDDLAQTLSRVDLKKTLVMVVSKSGGTLETATNEAFFRSQFEQAGLNPKNHFVAVTGEGSPMDNPKNYLEAFYMWDFVGGRFSATSMVGGVLISFTCGYSVFKELLKGCHAMDLVACNGNVRDNLPLMMALLGVWNHNFLGYPTVAVIPYSQALIRFPAHLQQCDMESNGKCIDQKGNFVSFSTGPIVWGEPGANAQHSFYQLLHQGTDVTPMEFIGFKNCQRGVDIEIQGTSSQEKLLSNLFAQAIALATGKKDKNPNKFFPGNRPSLMLIGSQLTPFALGSLLSLYEHKIAFQGFIWGINSFDQEGVQLGKVLANKAIDQFRSKRTGEKVEPFPLGQAFIDQLKGL